MQTATNFKNGCSLPENLEYKFWDNKTQQLVGFISNHDNVIIVIAESSGKRFAAMRADLRWATAAEQLNTAKAIAAQQRAAMAAAKANKQTGVKVSAAVNIVKRDDLPELPTNYVSKRTTRKKQSPQTNSLFND